MNKYNRKNKLVLGSETIRQLTASDALKIVGGLHITDASNATICLEGSPCVATAVGCTVIA